MICYLVRLDFSIYDPHAEPIDLVPWALKRIAENFGISFRRIGFRMANLSQNFLFRHADRNFCRITLVDMTAGVPQPASRQTSDIRVVKRFTVIVQIKFS
jgi:hypothetical protein